MHDEQAARRLVAQIFAGVGVTGFAHVRAIDGNGELDLHADQPVVMASVFKIAVAVELLRQVAAGELDPAERCRLPAATRSPGPTGLSTMRHDAELSLWDLAYQMMAVSDNAATDEIMARVGLTRVNATLAELGLRQTVVVGDTAGILRSMVEEAGLASWEELAPRLQEPQIQERLAGSAALDPQRATRTTPRELTRLLAMVWRGKAGPPEVREGVRYLLAQQICQARLVGAFPIPPLVFAKSGSLAPDVRNEAGVVDYPDGQRFAVAVFTRGRGDRRQPRGAVDRAIGQVGRLLVEYLRGAKVAARPDPDHSRLLSPD